MEEEKEEFYPDPYDEWHDKLIVEEYEKAEVLQERIDKAIEYIMTELISEWDIKNDGYVSGSDLPADAITPLLNILQGENK